MCIRDRQKGLLGEALQVVEPAPGIIADTIREIWKDKDRFQEMAEVGRSRMGPSGAAAKMAELILFRWYEEFAPPPIPDLEFETEPPGPVV